MVDYLFEIIRFTTLIAVAGLSVSVPGALAENSGSCTTEEAKALDFWIGDWRVVDAAGSFLGANKIERRLNGCALVEKWSGAGGFSGMSLFAFDAREKSWQQIWVTEDTSHTGGLKQKFQVDSPIGVVRFQGSYSLGEGRNIFDRTTLSPLPDGRVRQLIEVSEDGEQWVTSFEGVYEKAN